MRKRMLAAVVLVAALAMLGLASCGSSSSDENFQEGLPAWADEAAITEQAREIVDLVNARDFGEVAARWDDENVSAEKLEQSLGAALDQFGAFEGFADAKYGQSEPDGRSAATVIQRVDYEKQKAQFNVSFYEDGSLAGLYVYRLQD
ncbi:DUF3887 domain-containing protein [Gordonibacter massiliensis (ex Traore et al. 2017)]|uniref:DUF3887 domain-containing protein n=1 Tax=Gordonibacter massiliensis (ex Traore et al. 2017) TaxID=1841863 RepID=A0A842JMJ7_9ACTN|nr:DUF3887 domain-containing protein [Gordonibacter massiliensis (ex Traore et al. 2017)]MBC2890430.1 DUF3887 domain-containing protein [Gordonibacter massiliensis (ex Traore et al. 2017)]